MHIHKTNWKSVIIICSVCTAFSIVLHVLAAPLPAYDSPSFFVKNNIFAVTAAIFLFVTYMLLGVVFVFVQKNLSGKKMAKGLRFGLSFGGLWFFGVLGSSLMFDSPIKAEIAVATVDFLVLVLMGLLLGKFIASDSSHKVVEKDAKNSWSIFIIAFIYVVGRYLAYIVLNIELAYPTKLLGTLLWTMAIGTCMGIAYLLLKRSFHSYSPIKKAILFGCVVFGVNWILFNLFPALFVDIALIELLILAGSDILLFVFGIFLFEKMFAPKNLSDA